MSKVTVLAISHFIYLTEEERYNLFLLKDVETVGASIPVWFNAKHHSEPAKEVFCKYLIKNRFDDDNPIAIKKDGYEIILPYKNYDSPEMSDKKWRKMNQLEKLKWYDSWPKSITPKNLLNINDGGSESMRYREYDRLKSGEQILSIVHYVNIEDISKLEQSFIKGNLS